ncbi:hypothetical protein ACFFQW_35250 [Umezawaea endophytica]|uniref:Secreted protein n=1 Tax=Umezawaea endophytica TaxID=1654476 RepID=A0A9X2VGE9_9PSEU|nr:hypothetical protein [Umezawaea endophytica]MCS7475659.1 hypothetical protein [Umezawaea endophytica]
MDFLGAVATLACLPVSLAVFAWFAARARRQGGGHSLMAPFEDMWDPGSHRTHIEVQVRHDRRAPAPAPGDPPPP